jgi:uncharacterized integral membrane protein
MISRLALLVLFFLLLGFALKNMDGVTVRYYLGLEWQAPLAFVLLVMFAIGILAGIATNLAVIARQRRELLVLKRELHGRRQTPAAMPLESI